MGATHVLMVALMGITYGWQNDGSGGVEYIVQVSPDELKQIDHLGEISSIIDPAVAGQVSRITIRVGSERLPRQTPSPNTTTMMKPDPDNGATGPVLQLPSFPTAAPGTTGFSNNGIDPLANPNPNPFNNPGSRTNVGGQVPAPSMAAANPNRPPTLPPFAGRVQNNNQATTFAGGPSTEPTKTRDQSWKDWAGPRPNGPSTVEVGSDRMRINDPRTSVNSATNPANSNTGSSSRQTGGTFGQPPVGMTFPNHLDSSAKVANDQRSGNNLGFPNNPKVSNQLSPNRQFATEPPTAPNRRLTHAELAAGARSFDKYGNLVDQNGRRISMPPLNSHQPDPRASIYPRPGIDTRYDYAQSRARLEQPMPNRNDGNQGLRQREPIQYERNRVQAPRDQRYQQTLATQNVNRAGSSRTRLEHDPLTSSKDLRREPESQSDRTSTSAGASRLSEIPRTARNHVAAQPLFNGLLLISFVANIYLMFWLKNLRIRFRDMVAAKRVAGPDTQPV